VLSDEAQTRIHPVGRVRRNKENEQADASAYALGGERSADVSDVHLLAGAGRPAGVAIDQERHQSRNQQRGS
jgi:hypothetical protein